MFAAAFFDMDGLFLDSETHWHDAQLEFCARYGYQWDDEDQRICIGGPLSRVGQYIAEVCKIDLSGSDVEAEIIAMMLVKLRASVHVMPGAMDAVLLLKAIAPVALVSASPRNLMDAGLASLPNDLFEFTISADDVRRTKPHPDPYLAAAARLGVDPRECVVFEDSIPGITAARSAGMYVVAVPQFIEVAAASRQRVIATLEGLDRTFLNEIYLEN